MKIYLFLLLFVFSCGKKGDSDSDPAPVVQPAPTPAPGPVAPKEADPVTPVVVPPTPVVPTPIPIPVPAPAPTPVPVFTADSFAGYCTSSAASNDQKYTVNVVLNMAGTKDCAAANTWLQSREYLSFINNGLVDISPLKELKNLRQLKLEGNSIKDLSPIVGMVSLKKLMIKDAVAPSVAMLTSLKELTDFVLHAPNVVDISAVASFTKLENLEIENTKADTLSDTLSKLPVLRRLELHNNKFKTVVVANHPKILSVGLSGESLTGASFSNMDILDVVAVYGAKNFSRLELDKLPLMQKLRITDTAMISLDVSKVPYLIDLYLPRNFLEEIIASNNARLRSVEVSFNNLKRFDALLLPNVERISAVGNDLEWFGIEDNAALKSVDVSKNKLFWVRLANVPRLEKLIANENAISSIDLIRVPSLYSIDLNKNSIKDINFTRGVTNLRHLSVAENPIGTSIPVSKVNCPTNDVSNYILDACSMLQLPR